jgi:hypothetical protein
MAAEINWVYPLGKVVLGSFFFVSEQPGSRTKKISKRCA